MASASCTKPITARMDGMLLDVTGSRLLLFLLFVSSFLTWILTWHLSSFHLVSGCFHQAIPLQLLAANEISRARETITLNPWYVHFSLRPLWTDSIFLKIPGGIAPQPCPEQAIRASLRMIRSPVRPSQALPVHIDSYLSPLAYLPDPPITGG